MTGERLDIRLKQFVQAVDALQLALDQPEDEFIRDSIIKRFELAFETARKSLRRWLIEHEEVAESATKKEVMEAAHRVGLLADADAWSTMTRWRNDSSHEYDAAKALQAVAYIRAEATTHLRALVAAFGQRP
jgi:nucleotidyltransferase substrate binding protein (TIGR01987 family)